MGLTKGNPYPAIRKILCIGFIIVQEKTVQDEFQKLLVLTGPYSETTSPLTLPSWDLVKFVHTINRTTIVYHSAAGFIFSCSNQIYRILIILQVTRLRWALRTKNCQIHKTFSFICKILRLFLPPATKLREGNVFTPVCHSVHRRVSVQGISVQGGLCPGGSLSGRPLCTVKCGQYASYWNAFFSLNVGIIVIHAKRTIISSRKKNVCHLTMVRPYHKLSPVIFEESHKVLTWKIKRDFVEFLFCNWGWNL